jgi:hypothetical protein
VGWGVEGARYEGWEEGQEDGRGASRQSPPPAPTQASTAHRLRPPQGDVHRAAAKLHAARAALARLEADHLALLSSLERGSGQGAALGGSERRARREKRRERGKPKRAEQGQQQGAGAGSARAPTGGEEAERRAAVEGFRGASSRGAAAAVAYSDSAAAQQARAQAQQQLRVVAVGRTAQRSAVPAVPPLDTSRLRPLNVLGALDEKGEGQHPDLQPTPCPCPHTAS